MFASLVKINLLISAKTDFVVANNALIVMIMNAKNVIINILSMV